MYIRGRSHPYHDREDQGHDVDGVCGTKTGENSQTKVAAEGRRSFLLRTGVEEHTPTQGTLYLRMKLPKRHSEKSQTG